MRADKMEHNLQALMDPRAVEAVETLRGFGYEAWLVGGAVRDALRGVEPHDYDIAWNGAPQDLFKAIDARYLHPTGVQHGTMTWVYRGLAMEVTSFRIEEGYGDHRRPDKVRFVDRIEDDLARRDLTFNAMAWAPKEGLLDPFGGRTDLQAGRVRTVGDPYRRFSEDALRILRTLRFAALLDGQLDPGTRTAIHAQAADLKHVARERIWNELLQLLVLPGAGKVIFRGGRILFEAFPQLQLPECTAEDISYWRTATRLMDALKDREELRVAWCYYIYFLGILADDSLDQMNTMVMSWERTIKNEPLSRRLRGTVRALLTALQELELDVRFRTSDESNRSRWMERFDALGHHADPADLLSLIEASYNLVGGKRRAEILRHGQALFEGDGMTLRPGVLRSRRDLAVRGSDLLQWGVTEGPAVRQALDALWRAVIAGEAPNERDRLRVYWESQNPKDKG